MRLALTLLAIFYSGSAFAQTIGPSLFRDELAKAVSAETGIATETIDEKTFKTKRADGTELTVSIDNAYAEYQRDPKSLSIITARFAKTLAQSAPSSRERIDQLVVIVRPSDYVSKSVQPGASLENFVPARPLAGDLSFFLAVDSPTAIRSLAPSDLKRWKIDETVAWSRAIANVKMRVGPISMIRLGTEAGPSGLSAESGLAPSILSDPALCSSEHPNGMGGQILLLYARDTLLFVMPDDEASIATFWKSIKVEIQEGRSISKTPITCKSGRWEAVALP